MAQERQGDRVFKKRNGGAEGEPSGGLIGVPKGLQQMLGEIDLFQQESESKPPPLQCKKCGAENKAKREAIPAFDPGGEGREQVLEQRRREEEECGDVVDSLTGGEDEGGGIGGARCCARKILSGLEASRIVLNRVEQVFKKRGHLCVFLPKHRPEFNAIERFWGHPKYLIRLHVEYSLPHLLATLPSTLRGIPTILIRKWARVSWLYVKAHDDGLEDYLPYRDLKEWTSHRSPFILRLAGRNK